jgi:hypothetical protein
MFCLWTFCLYGRFVPTEVLSLQTFCPYGRFVSTDVLSLRTFCPTDVMSPAVLSPDVLSPDVLSLRTFCLRTFCLGTFVWGMRHTSTALYFCGASKKSLHKPRATSENRLFHISYDFNYYVQLLYLQFLSKTHLHFKKFTFCIKIVLFLKSLLYHSMIAKIVHV